MKRLLLIAVLVILLVFCWGYYSFSAKDWTVATLDVGDGRRIRISIDNEWEPRHAYCYEVTVRGEVVAPPTFIGAGDYDDDPNFYLAYSRDRNVVGVVEKSDPDSLLLIHDFASGRSWPRGIGEGDARVGDDLLQELQQNYPSMGLVLDGDIVVVNKK